MDNEAKDNSPRHFWLYVLELEDEKYYVGITTKADPNTRIKMHGGSFGARWTQKHKPIATLETRDLGIVTSDEAARQEQKATLDYMKRYGYKNVRGGTLSYSGNYTKLGDRYFTEEQWSMLKFAVFMTFICLFSLIILILGR